MELYTSYNSCTATTVFCRIQGDRHRNCDVVSRLHFRAIVWLDIKQANNTHVYPENASMFLLIMTFQ